MKQTNFDIESPPIVESGRPQVRSAFIEVTPTPEISNDLCLTIKATVDLISVFLSINQLAVANALAIAGWILGSLLIVVFSLTSFFVINLCGILAANNERWMHLDLVGEDAFGERSVVSLRCSCGQWALRNLFRLMLLVELLMYVAEFSLLTVDFIFLLPGVRDVPVAWYFEWLMMVGVLVICLLLSKLREGLLRVLNSMTTMSALITLVLFLVFAEHKIQPTDIGPGQPSRLGLSFVIMNAFSGYPVFSKTYATVQSKRLFNRVVLINQLTTTATVCIIGVSGYFFYGRNVSSEVIILCCGPP